jgi:predicted protein tyrosine phosphatase
MGRLTHVGLLAAATRGRFTRARHHHERIMTARPKLLFVCSQNRIRSLTAETLFEGSRMYDVRSAGTDANARIKITAGHIGWADSIFVMEKRHQNLLRRKFREELREKTLVCLHIPDEYEPHADDLKEILRARLMPHLELPDN